MVLYTQSGVRACLVSCVAASLLALVAASAPSAAAPKRISGSLSKPGYTVIALAAHGKATSVRAKRRKFRLRPPASRVTLHLRARNGRYAGPVVVGRDKSGKRAILGVTAGARLGKIEIRNGYAKLAKRLRTRSVDANRRARAMRGVPIGARVFGRVRSRAGAAVPGDGDLDGIPDVFDIDDDGDLVLDNLDRSTSAREARAAGAAQAGGVHQIRSILDLQLEESVNANGGSTGAEIDAALPTLGILVVPILPDNSVELDCGGSPNPSPPPPLLGGLVYCSSAGTGSVLDTTLPPGSVFRRFPDCCDRDGDGFGTLAPSPGLSSVMGLLHGATTDQIGTGDVLIHRVTTDGAETQYPTTLQYVFSTVPALATYSDTGGNSATVQYPLAPGAPGTNPNGFPVEPGPDGDIVVTLTFWRSQRRPIPPETGEWIDIGRLAYSADVLGSFCPQSAYSEADPNLAPHPLRTNEFEDLAADQPASAANTFTYTLNLTQCLAAAGGLPWNSGEFRGFGFQGVAEGGDSAEQHIGFTRE